jgi:hypothetical protein
LKDKLSKTIIFTSEVYKAYAKVRDFEADNISIYYSSFLEESISYKYNFDQQKAGEPLSLGTDNIKTELI